MSVSLRSVVHAVSRLSTTVNVQVRTGPVVLRPVVDEVALGQILLLWIHFSSVNINTYSSSSTCYV